MCHTKETGAPSKPITHKISPLNPSVMGSGGLAVYTPAVPAPWGDLFQGRWL